MFLSVSLEPTPKEIVVMALDSLEIVATESVTSAAVALTGLKKVQTISTAIKHDNTRLNVFTLLPP